MPKIIRVSLTPQQRIELNQRARARSLSPRMRDRLEMIRLSDMGQTIPQIASVLQCERLAFAWCLRLHSDQCNTSSAAGNLPHTRFQSSRLTSGTVKGSSSSSSCRAKCPLFRPLLSLAQQRSSVCIPDKLEPTLPT